MNAHEVPLGRLLLPDGELSRSDLDVRAEALAAELRRQGLARGDLVICPVGDATAEFVVMQIALARNHCALLPIDNQLDTTELRQLAAQTGVDWVWEPTHPTTQRRGQGQMDHGHLLSTGLAPKQSRSADADSADAGQGSALALVVRTSGSSGGCKAAMLSAAALQTSCERINQRLGLGCEDLWLCALPRQHIGGLAIGYRCALAGAGMLLHGRFDAARVAADLWRHPVTHLSLVPAMLARLLAQCPRPPQWLRVVLIGGQALDRGLARRALVAGWPLLLGYGMTETCSFIASRVLDEHGEQSLQPLPDVQLEAPRCARESGALPLRLRAPMLMLGYANPERRPGLGLDDQGWLQTADLACLKDTSFLRIMGRADDQLVIAGVNVQPGLIEESISDLEGVSQCALVGVPEPVWGQTLVALYQGSIGVDALECWCREHLPSPQRPRLLVPIKDWPLLASGKEDRTRLREIATKTLSAKGAHLNVPLEQTHTGVGGSA
ncbi:2-succinylbenzoate--CoA ligase [Thiorhodovibrio winogradskyi]|uniref:2-succinylbenzoate--CoA ligase n=1 Tax=Thiorhodovibrio winogradskyi TaxID=77007 RepID=A0ABZ0SD35_9GAMM|nr:AMP-binding protein [Thiorhodovibrio winogradskyi]